MKVLKYNISVSEVYHRYPKSMQNNDDNLTHLTYQFNLVMKAAFLLDKYRYIFKNDGNYNKVAKNCWVSIEWSKSLAIFFKDFPSYLCIQIIG